MLSARWLSTTLRSCSHRSPILSRSFCATQFYRDAGLGSSKISYDEKYAEKLQRRAQELGKSVDDLRGDLREQERQRRVQRLEEEAHKSADTATSSEPTPSLKSSSPSSSSPSSPSRKDSSPVKPLSSILNLDKLLETPHTPEQISLLWRAYHESRSGGTGRGFLCATVPVESYTKMLDVARKYPTFVLPVPRPTAQPESGAPEPEPVEPAYEFYLMEWGLHGAPPDPATARALFPPPPPTVAGASRNPQTSTVLFTPLQEYKLRQAFATPYLVLTQYTDLVHSHGLVLLRGEITPSAASASGAVGAGAGEGTGERFMLSQQDAQLLAVHLQRFYLWNEGSEERAALLRAFHDAPAEFKWEELLKHTDFAA